MFHKKSILILFFAVSNLFAEDFTISTYNCGSLSDHYDYLRAVAMQKLIQERYDAEPENMALNERMQAVALKILFAKNENDKKAMQKEWKEKGYEELSKKLTSAPSEPNSPNLKWNKKSEEIITTYKIRPISIFDQEVKEMLLGHIGDMTKEKDADLSHLTKARDVMAKRIFANHLKYDIICLQEADYLDDSTFPEHYQVLFSNTEHSRNGVVWNTNRFDLVEDLGDGGRAYAVKLLDKSTNKIILVVSGHLSGCNPYRQEIDPITGASDSEKGDLELKEIVAICEDDDVDMCIIGMDSNVTSLHPRMNILKDGNFNLDAENYLEPTCSSPHQILNTRIDWIALKSKESAKITNIPVSSVGLNSLRTNMSDHKPIAAKISY